MNNVVVFLAQFSHNFDQSCTTNGIRYALGTAACLSNGLLLVVILGTKKLRKQHSTCLVALLAVAGSLIGVGAIVRASYAIYSSAVGITQFNRQTCVLWNTPLGMGFAATRVAVIAIGVDRLEIVLRPLHYRNKFQMIKFFTVFMLMTFFVGLNTFFSLYGIDEQRQITTICSIGASQGPLATSFGTIYADTSIVLLIAVYLTCLAAFMRRMRAQTAAILNLEHYRMEQLKRSGAAFLLIFIYTFSWGISFLLLQISQTLPNGYGPILASATTQVFGLVGTLNATLAITIFWFRNEEVRKASKKLFRKLFKKN